MTKNQIEYMKAIEGKRSNLASEQLTRERNANDYSIAVSSLDENIRSHKANEALQGSALAETQLHNRNTEALTYQSLLEQQLHNRNTEALTAQNIQLGYANLAEQNRSNVAREIETNRANVAKETEQHRANVRNEELTLNRINTDRELKQWQLAFDKEKLQQDKELKLKEYGLKSEELKIRDKEWSEKARHNFVSEFVGLVDAVIPF